MIVFRTVMLWLNPITIFLFITLYPEVGGYDWLQLISRVGKTVHSIENSRWFRLISNIDLTAGGIHLSTPIPQETKSESSERQGLALRYNSMTVSNSYEEISTSSLANLQSELSKFENITTTNLGLLRVHRLGATALKKVPDSFLIGLISLIAAELLQREILRQSLSFPPIVQAIANKTAVELDVKLQLLSALQWNVGPFLEYELDNLQTQPIEILDKYVIGEIIFRIDRDLAPFLSKIIRDPALVKKIVSQVKAIVEILAIAIAKNAAAASSTNTTKGGSRIIENFELMIEGALHEWNKLIDDLGKVMKSESFIQYLHYYPNSNNNTSSSSRSIIVSPSVNQMNWEEVEKREREDIDEDRVDEDSDNNSNSASKLRVDGVRKGLFWNWLGVRSNNNNKRLT